MKNKGFSLIEALMAMVILATGSVAFVKATSNYSVTNVDYAEQQQVAQMAATLNNLIAAHAQSLPPGASKGQLIAHIQLLTNAIEGNMKQIEKSKGYSCVRSTPLLNSSPQELANNKEITATLFKVWLQGPPICVEFNFLNNTPADLNSVWVETVVNRPSLVSANGSTGNANVRLPVLIGVVPS